MTGRVTPPVRPRAECGTLLRGLFGARRGPCAIHCQCRRRRWPRPGGELPGGLGNGGCRSPSGDHCRTAARMVRALRSGMEESCEPGPAPARGPRAEAGGSSRSSENLRAHLSVPEKGGIPRISTLPAPALSAPAAPWQRLERRDLNLRVHARHSCTIRPQGNYLFVQQEIQHATFETCGAGQTIGFLQ